MPKPLSAPVSPKAHEQAVAAARESAQKIARDAATRYFDALASEIPVDGTPGDVNLTDVALEMREVLLAPHHPVRVGDPDGWEEGATMDAGYLLGIEIGRRLGGAR